MSESEKPVAQVVDEETLAKVLVKIWGYEWVDFSEIPPMGTPGHSRIGEAYSIRLDAQDAARGILRRYAVTPLYTASQLASLQREALERAAKECDRIDNQCGMEAGLGAACAAAIRSMKPDIKEPNPGTKEAIRKGCTCPVIDNHHGRGYFGRPSTFVYSGDCPLHDVRALLRTKGEDNG